MPPYKCTICNSMVSKRKSYSHNGGRACKIHKEASDATKDRLDKEATDRKAKEKLEQDRKHDFVHGIGAPQEDPKWCRTHCWICECEGYTPEEVPMRMLVAMQKLQQAGNFNFLDITAQRTAAGFNEKPGLIDFQLGDEPIYYAILHACEKHTRPLVEFVKVARLCSECAQKVGIDVRETLADRMPQKSPSLKTLAMLGATFETSALADNIKTQAAIENLEAGVAIENATEILTERLEREKQLDECIFCGSTSDCGCNMHEDESPVDSDGNLVNNDGDAETDME